MARNLDLGLLRTFVAVADGGSMTVAANRLHVTQGAVSQQIKRLEQAFSCTLLAREGRKLGLSPVGERFLGQARHLLRINDEIWAEMIVHPLAGSLRIGVPQDLISVEMPPIVKAFASAHPHVEVSLICRTSLALTDMMEQGELDLALIEAPADTPLGESLRVEPLVWAGAPASTVHLKRPMPLSIVADTCAFRPVLFAALDAHGIAWRTVFESGNIEATTATVRSGLAVTAWLASTVPGDLEILDERHGLPALPDFSINLLMSGVDHPAAQEFARHARAGFARKG